MGQVDSTAIDSVVYGFSNVSRFNGWNISFSGILVVFGGLVLIALTIWLFNKISFWVDNRAKNKQETPAIKASEPLPAIEDIPLEHLLAISTTVELYKRLYLGQLESVVTFERGELNSNWKSGSRYGQRKSLR